MIQVRIPQLSATDYPEFHRICVGLPPTHAEWQLNQQRYHRRHGFHGQKLVRVPINPLEVKEYALREGCSLTADALYCVAKEKAPLKYDPSCLAS
jgi:hypothetical protein